MRKWVTDYPDIMKLVTNKQTVISLLSEILSDYRIITEENPFAAAGDDKKAEEEPAAEPEAGAEAGAEDSKDKEKKDKAPDSKALTISFNLSAVKKYNDAVFSNNTGEVKAITKDGIEVVVDNSETVYVNFNDIIED